MANVTPGKYKAAWIQAKRDFQSKSKVKKPAETLLWFRRASGIEPLLAKLDALTKNIARSQKDYAAYATAYKAFQLKLNEYDKLLQKAATATKLPSGANPSTYRQAVNELRVDLADIERAASGHGSTVETAINLLERLRANVGKARKFINTVRRNPTPEKFNDKVDTVARHITQQLNNVDRVEQAGFGIGREAPTNLIRILKAWGNDGREVDTEASGDEVLLEVEAFEQAVNGVEAWLD